MASKPTSIFIGSGPGGAHPQQLELKRANRHGLIAGATGTGKTVTLQGIVEGLSEAGVPTFVADVKGVFEVETHETELLVAKLAVT